VQASTVVLSVLGLLLPATSIAQAGDIPSIDFSRSYIHREAPRGAEAVPPVLRPSPELAIRMADGKPLLLSSFRGQVVALVFIHTTCPICQEASRVFTKLSAEYGARGFQPLDVAFNSMANLNVQEFTTKFAVRYPVGSSTLQEVMEYLGFPAHQRFTIPQIVWIDRNGDIRAQTPARGGDSMLTETYWRNMIEMLLSEDRGT